MWWNWKTSKSNENTPWLWYYKSFHSTYYFATGCYCSWRQRYQLLIEHTFMNICVNKCVHRAGTVQVHTHTKQKVHRGHTHTLYFEIKLSRSWNLRSLVKFHTPSVGRHEQGKHLQICMCMCALLNITDCTLLLPQRMGPKDTSPLSFSTLIFTNHNNKDHADSNSDYTGLSQVSAPPKHILRLVSGVLDCCAVWFLPLLLLSVRHFCDTTNAQKCLKAKVNCV